MLAGRLLRESDDSDNEVLLYAVGNKRESGYTKLMKRREFGEFYDVMKQLRQDEGKFKEYFRMSSNQFEQLCHLSRMTLKRRK